MTKTERAVVEGAQSARANCNMEDPINNEVCSPCIFLEACVAIDALRNAPPAKAVEMVAVDGQNGLTSLVDPVDGYLLYAEIVHRGSTSREIFENGKHLRIEVIENDGPMPGGPY